MGLSFCLFINFCNVSETQAATEAVEDESTPEEEPLLSTLDIVVLGLAGKNMQQQNFYM